VATDAVAVAVAPTARFANGRDLLGQPRGLFFIGATELWERISFHGMQALLVLYMVERCCYPATSKTLWDLQDFERPLRA